MCLVSLDSTVFLRYLVSTRRRRLLPVGAVWRYWIEIELCFMRRQQQEQSHHAINTSTFVQLSSSECMGGPLCCMYC